MRLLTANHLTEGCYFFRILFNTTTTTDNKIDSHQSLSFYF